MAFPADGRLVPPTEVLHGRPVLLEPGQFAETHHDAARRGVRPTPRRRLARSETWLLVFRRRELYRMTEIVTRFTASPIRFVTGVSTLVEIFQDRGNDGLAGALLEALARLFARNVRIYACPMRADALADRLAASSLTPWTGAADGADLIAADHLQPAPPFGHLYAYLMDTGFRVPAAGRQRLSGGIAAEVQVQATGHWQAIERHLSRYPLYPDVATTHEGTQEALRHGLDQHHVIDTGVHATGPGGTEAIVLRDAWVQRPV